MLYIRKSKTPQSIKQKRDEIVNTPDIGYNEIVLPEDTKKLRLIFEKMPKVEIREALCKEQHGLCAYCMRRIVSQKENPNDQETRIEYYTPLSRNKELALDYQNFLGVCHGGNKDEREKEDELITCCDAHRSNTDLTINPWDKRQMETIADPYVGVRIYVLEKRYKSLLKQGK